MELLNKKIQKSWNQIETDVCKYTLQWYYTVDASQKLAVTKSDPVSLSILAQPFAHGSSHLAYYAVDGNGNKLVAKRLLYEPVSAHSSVENFQVNARNFKSTASS